MANEQGNFAMSFFPSPPPFWRDFTTENQERLQQFKQDNPSNDEEGASSSASSPKLTATQLLQLPAELRNLVPPDPPTDDQEFRVFNEITKSRGIDDFDSIMKFISHDLNERHLLQDWQYKQLYPSTASSDEAGSQSSNSNNNNFDRQQYLLRFMRSILLSYVELLGILAVDPTSESKDQKLKDILNLVANAHALVNEYRPHQARETLIIMMEEQLEKKRAEVEGVKRMKEKVEETLAGFAKQVPSKPADGLAGDGIEVPESERKLEGQRHMWQAMDEILGH